LWVSSILKKRISKMEITDFRVFSIDDNDENTRFPNDEGFIIVSWARDSKHFDFKEFGEIILTKKKDGTITLASECMGKTFVKEVLSALVDKAEIIE
jgi:hypothetical protein